MKILKAILTKFGFLFALVGVLITLVFGWTEGLPFVVAGIVGYLVGTRLRIETDDDRKA